MRVTTKIKKLLTVYVLEINMDENAVFWLTIIHKKEKIEGIFEALTWAAVVDKAYKWFLKNEK